MEKFKFYINCVENGFSITCMDRYGKETLYVAETITSLLDIIKDLYNPKEDKCSNCGMPDGAVLKK